jgi:hypothetical protein
MKPENLTSQGAREIFRLSSRLGSGSGKMNHCSTCHIQKPIVLERAPEICVEIISPSNTESEIQEKQALYFEAGAFR